ncbi:DUF58 domain-containing protein [Candidatus Sumerlaeota bacterium]|nr:DUF58 domain-containing protein [Candidatus Sumerlaeota bacterium]
MEHDLSFSIFTRRNVLLFAAALAISTGLTLRLPALLFLGEFLLALMALAWLTSFRLADSMRVSREHYPHAFEESRLPVTLHVSHDSRFAAEMFIMTDHFNPGDPYHMRCLECDPFRSGQDLLFVYEGVCSRRRGLYVIGPLRVSTGDALGVFEFERTLECVTPVYVLPKSTSIDAMPLLSQGTLFHVGGETVRRPGHSESFIHLRDYRTGDHPRLIHWPTSARRDVLTVREIEDQAITEVNIFLDLRRIAQRGVGDKTSTELIVKAGACLAQTAIEKSHMARVFAIGSRTETVELGAGVAHLHLILSRMAIWRPEGARDFGELCNREYFRVKPGATVAWVVSASVFQREWLEPVIPQMLENHVLPIVVFVDDRSFIKLLEAHEMYEVEGEELEALVARFKELGCTVYTVGRTERLETQLALPR